MDRSARVDEVCGLIVTAPDPDWLMGFSRRLIRPAVCIGYNFEPIRTIHRLTC